MVTHEPNAILTGGPGFLPETERLRYVPDIGSKFRLLNGNRWEHFEPTAKLIRRQGRDLVVFIWSRHTYVAE
ncbi:DUF5988 family protein [Streptomyces aurantiacus]|uniref:DUF5988 family protein n=1 Tax=Streptomyces aurantiacus TaxID=47760 RepID=UPI0006E30406|nr:DUF5988 family protein [Streptomyces aurantiacus]